MTDSRNGSSAGTEDARRKERVSMAREICMHRGENPDKIDRGGNADWEKYEPLAGAVIREAERLFKLRSSTAGPCACLRPGGDPLGNCVECDPPRLIHDAAQPVGMRETLEKALWELTDLARPICSVFNRSTKKYEYEDEHLAKALPGTFEVIKQIRAALASQPSPAATVEKTLPQIVHDRMKEAAASAGHHPDCSADNGAERYQVTLCDDGKWMVHTEGDIVAYPGQGNEEQKARMIARILNGEPQEALKPGKLTEDQIMQVIRKVTTGDLRKMLTCTRWKDGIDIDQPTYAAERLAEEFRAASTLSRPLSRGGE